VITWLIKPGELALKGGNRKTFEKILRQNLIAMLGTVQAKLEIKSGRYYVHAEEIYSETIEQALSCLIGIAGWARTITCPKTADAVMQACIHEARRIHSHGAASFKIEARRTDKSFPLDSYALRVNGGEEVLKAVPDLKVDVHKPDCIITIEIREKSYVYSNSTKGLGGLPVGSGGRGLLLISGGIDSPVAGFRMACRGMGFDAIHFHSYPYTSAEARQKVIDLCAVLSRYCLSIRLHIIGFTEIQKRIKERAPENWATVLLRMGMMEAAETIAKRTRAKCLITGESLSQVASQTIENLSCTESRIKLPVLRPLIGDNKESIIRLAEKIGTYTTSILPYEDCCILFSPPHPVLRGNVTEANELYEALQIEDLLAEAIHSLELVKLTGGMNAAVIML